MLWKAMPYSDGNWSSCKGGACRADPPACLALGGAVFVSSVCRQLTWRMSARAAEKTSTACVQACASNVPVASSPRSLHLSNLPSTGAKSPKLHSIDLSSLNPVQLYMFMFLGPKSRRALAVSRKCAVVNAVAMFSVKFLYVLTSRFACALFWSWAYNITGLIAWSAIVWKITSRP